MDNLNQKFLKELSKVKDPTVFVGVCVILKVDIYEDEEKKVVKDFGKVLEEVMAGYDGAGRKRKKELLNILRKANKEKTNGFRTEDTETAVQNKEVQ